MRNVKSITVIDQKKTGCASNNVNDVSDYLAS